MYFISNVAVYTIIPLLYTLFTDHDHQLPQKMFNETIKLPDW